uniref:Uncharacterized protein n=1 Tax=Ciona savignyi TaxID=51511 RepID=H2ZIB0_CIOSA
MDSLLNKHAGPPEGKSYYLLYLGELTLHRVYSRCMSPWLLSNMNYQNHFTPCAFTIDHLEFTVVHEEKPLITLGELPCNGHLKNNNSKPQTGAYNSPMSPTVKSPNGFTVLNMHNLPLSCALNHVSDVIQVSELNECCVGFIVDRGFEHPLACHVLKCEDYNQSKEVGEKMSKLLTWNQTFSGCTQSSRNVKLEDLDSIRFEVLLLGKIQVKQEFPSPNFIDEAVDKYHSLEKEHAASVAESKLIQNLSVDLRKRNSIDEGGR